MTEEPRPDQLPTDTDAGEKLARQIVSDIERRRADRVALALDTEWTSGPGGSSSGIILNLSSRGLFMATEDDLPALGESLKLKFAVEHAQSPQTVTIEGTVKRLWDPAVEGVPGVGVRIEQVDEGARPGVLRMFLRESAPARKHRGPRSFHTPRTTR